MMQHRHGKVVALIGAVLQAVFAAVLLVIWLWTGAAAAMSAMWFVVAGLPAWLMTAVIFYCRQLEQREELEFQEIGEQTAAETIFRGEGEQRLRLARQRLAFVTGWGVGIFTFLWLALHAGLAFLILRYLNTADAAEVITAPAQGTLFVALVAFVGFLFSFYSIGMSRRVIWRILRAPGSYLLVNVLAMAAVATGLLAAWQGYPTVGRWVAWIIPAVQVFFALELALNLVLEFFRPRLPGREEKPIFESRVFSLVALPQRVGLSIAQAINYQFGFEITSSWFYQLMARAFLPLLAVGAAVLLGLSCVVIVDEGEQYVVQRFGRLDPNRPPLGAGLKLKLPWPIETGRRFDVAQVREVLLGSEGHQDPHVREGNIFRGREYFVWERPHGVYKERDFIVAVPRVSSLVNQPAEGTDDRAEEIPAVNIIKLLVAVQYRISDVYQYGYEYQNPDEVLEDKAYEIMTKYCASATLDEPIADGSAAGIEALSQPHAPPLTPAARLAETRPVKRPEAIMTTGRDDLAEALFEEIRNARIDGQPLEEQLGIELLYVELQTVHPPPEAAQAYAEVLRAEREMVTRRYQAEGVANRVLAAAAGDPFIALKLGLRLSVLSNLQRLHSIRGNRPAFKAELDEQIGNLNESIDQLRKDIQIERELGRLHPDRRTDNQRLLEIYLQQAKEMRAIAEQAESLGRAPELKPYIQAARKRRDELFAQVEGQAAQMVAEASAARWRTQLDARSLETAFRRHLLPYRAAPQVYKLNLMMELWEAVLPDAQKTVLAVPRESIELWMNWERTESFVRQATMDTQDVPTGD